jgi:hypothetical protein
MSDELICALSGKPPKEAELVTDGPEDSVLDEAPLGWVAITVTRRLLNPNWVSVQEAKRATYEATMAQVPEEYREAQSGLVGMQIEAMYSALETRHPKYVEDEQVSYISDPDEDDQVAEALADLMEGLEMEPYDDDGAPEDEGPAGKSGSEDLPDLNPPEPPMPPEPR